MNELEIRVWGIDVSIGTAIVMVSYNVPSIFHISWFQKIIGDIILLRFGFQTKKRNFSVTVTPPKDGTDVRSVTHVFYSFDFLKVDDCTVLPVA